MKRFCAILILLSLPLAGYCGEEEELLGVLQTNQSLQAKDAACSRLKWIGTAKSVPALAELLTDPQLSVSARYALESMPLPEAEQALLQGLLKTSGSNEVGIVHSLGVRAEAAAEPDLAKLLSDPDPEVAVAAADALGKTGGTAACQALQAAWTNSTPGPAHDAQTDSLLACGNRSLAGHEWKQALPVFQEIYDHETNNGIRLAAYRGVILASEKRGIILMVKAMEGPGGPGQGAALELASTVGGTATTKALSGLLAKEPPAMQIALMQALDQRGDRGAAHDMIDMLDSPDPAVRMAAITTLGDLGDGRDVMKLARQAASATGTEKAAARQALVNLRHGEVTAAMLRLLGTEAPDVKVELITALGDRGEALAARQLLAEARTADDSIRSASFQALALVAGPAEIPDMVQVVVQATNDDGRSEAADALGSACQRLDSQKRPMDLEDLAKAARTAPLEARLALLNVCSGVGAPRIREVLRASASDGDARVREAALRAICNSQDEQLLPDILKEACSAEAGNFRMLGIRGCVRLITQEQGVSLPNAQKVETLKAILSADPNIEAKRLVLSGLASVADPKALEMAVSMLRDPEVKTEAAEATVQIARAISPQHPEEASSALKHVLAGHPDAGIRKTAQAALKRIKVKE